MSLSKWLMGVGLVVVLCVPRPAFAAQYVPKPVIAEGLARRLVVVASNVPEAFDLKEGDPKAPSSAPEAGTVSYELDDIEVGLWYNDGQKNQYAPQSMVRKGAGVWLCNYHRSALEIGKWYGNIYKLDVTLWFQSGDDTKRIRRRYSTAEGAVLQSLHVDISRITPREINLDMSKIDPKME